MSHWHTLSAEDALKQLGTDSNRGLDEAESRRRLKEHGPNELEEHDLKSPWRILWEQLTSAMVVILIAAAIISLFLGDRHDALAILVIVVLNALLGFRQEYKAEKALAALKALAVPLVKVRRGGSVEEISARELVPGDIVMLDTGNLVPADGRLIEGHNLRIQESALTGESEPVEKLSGALSDTDAALADRHNMVYMGTVVTYGRGRAVITRTGMGTELGRIATMIQTVGSEPTPLQRRLNQLGRGLAVAALFLVAVVFSLGFIRGEELKGLFLVAISMAVAAVPEGLPAVVTIALALGSQRMLKRRALIRKLPAVETLGSVTVICSDKTGTLTQNRMTVTVLNVADFELELSGVGEDRDGGSQGDERDHKLEQGEGLFADRAKHPPAVGLLLLGGALCNDAVLKTGQGEAGRNRFEALGDPTEGALVVAAARMGLIKTGLDDAFPRICEAPFDSSRKRMTTVHRTEGPQIGSSEPILEGLRFISSGEKGALIGFTKGGVDSVSGVCSRILVGDRIEPLGGAWRERILAANDRLAAKGMRVLGVACRGFDDALPEAGGEALERDLIFLGMAGLIDPPRPEVRDAVATCRSAGIRPIMITGDHPLTAHTIAHELGIGSEGGAVTGKDLAGASADELDELVEKRSIYARVSPEHKLSIVEALQNRHHIVAMTGDGVNDAPALKKADIGVAMGITGTDVTKQVADMVLLDDNFATIVAAVEEGRVIYDNIRKFMRYLLTTNSGEIWVMLLAPFLGMPLPLLPLQILWINLVTDGLPALALGVEPAEPDVMRRPPHDPKESIFGRGMSAYILWVGLLMGLVPLLAGYAYWREGAATWQTMVFCVLTFSQMSQALAIRSSRYSLFTIGVLSNKPLLGAVLLTTALQFVVVYSPFFQAYFKTVPLSAREMLLCLALSTVVFWGVEGWKWSTRRLKP